MKEYIERSAILDTLADPFRKASDETEVEILKCWDRIKKIPAADVRPVVRGKWARKRYGPWASGLKCSECELLFDIATDQPSWNFCPACGAKMDGGVSDA